jgi:hypothetical protein
MTIASKLRIPAAFLVAVAASLGPTLAATLAVAASPTVVPDTLPGELLGTWKIIRVIPTQNQACWPSARTLVGATLTYQPGAMRWRGGEVPLTGVVTRSLTAEEFRQEAAQTWGVALTLADLHIATPIVTEVDLQHEDADITGSTTEVPGDSVLLARRNTIVVSACGTFFEAVRIKEGVAPARSIR